MVTSAAQQAIKMCAGHMQVCGNKVTVLRISVHCIGVCHKIIICLGNKSGLCASELHKVVAVPHVSLLGVPAEWVLEKLCGCPLHYVDQQGAGCQAQLPWSCGGVPCLRAP